ncbi:MAG: VOC family protein [Oscillospiraceae bacterium]|jgi:lactoylglutathione lyase|nr:VOC family protein [Oscillospiraceae bacterium]
MTFKMIHNNLNVANLSESLRFYADALGLRETRRVNGDGFVIVYLSDGEGGHLLELTELSDHPQKYDLGENEIHLAFETDDYAAAFAKHSGMGCVCFENPQMGIYFIEDPDGYWLEILPANERRGM